MDPFANEIASAFETAPFQVTGSDAWPSCFAVTELAVQSMAAVGSALAALVVARGTGRAPPVSVDRRLASLWFSWSIRPQGWELPSAWDAIAGDYEGHDGWIRLHTNTPSHRTAALSVLGCKPERDEVASAVRRWSVETLESDVVRAGGAAAAMRSRADWLDHPQGAAVTSEPLVHWHCRPGTVRDWQAREDRPLSGLRVLDLTRVLAGPVATRALAGFGANVLRVDPPGWEEPGIVPDVTLGKRCCRLDLRTPEGRGNLESLLSRADILVHGYRPGALGRLLNPKRRMELAPGLIEISLDAYGWTGPMAGRRGFDSLVQMSSGIAEAGMRWAGSDRPHPLPVQALDHATGYLMAAAALTALTRAVRGEGVCSARLSLARTAELLATLPVTRGRRITGSELADLDDLREETAWGPARRLKPAIRVSGAPMRWDRPARDLGSAAPVWR